MWYNEEMSVESIMSDVFSTSATRYSFGFESEMIDEEITQVMDDESGDVATAAIESTLALSDANALVISLRAQESFIWSVEEEDLDIGEGLEIEDEEKAEGETTTEDNGYILGEKKTKSDSIWKRFWEFVKSIATKVKEAVANFIKQMEIMAASVVMKSRLQWLEYNYNKHQKVIASSNVTHKVKLFNGDFGRTIVSIYDIRKTAETFVDKALTLARSGMVKNPQSFLQKIFKSNNDGIDEYVSTAGEISEKLSFANLNEMAYGKNETKIVECNEWFASLGTLADKFGSLNDIKRSIDAGKADIKESKKLLEDSSKSINVTDVITRKVLRQIITAGQTVLVKSSSANLFIAREVLKSINTSYRFAKSAMDNYEKEHSPKSLVNKMVTTAAKHVLG